MRPVPIVPRAFVNQSLIASGVARATRTLKPEVVRIRYSIGEDWAGAPSIFFRVVLSNAASRELRLGEVAPRVTKKLLDEIDVDELGLHAYFNFRSLSEQATMKEEEWA